MPGPASILILAKKKAAGHGGFFDPMAEHAGMAMGPMMFEMAEEEEDEVVPVARRAAEDEDDEDLTTPDDVEADLDTILKDRLVAAEDQPNEDDEEQEVEDRSTDGDALQPRRADEEMCTSCFLLVRRAAPNCPVGDDDCPIFAR